MKKVFRKFGFTKKYMIGSIFTVIVFLATILINSVLFPNIELTGGEKISIEYKEKYNEAGYSAVYFGEDITDDVKVEGKVNTNKLGVYKVTYTVGSGLFSRKVVRYIEVSDTTKPKLSINSDNAYVCPGSKYEIETVKAVDNFDGDLTSKVKHDLKKDAITYFVTDSNGNKKSVTKKIVYKDVEKPVITLKGSDVIEMCTNEVYKDPGYTAVDNCDKDLTSKVNVDGTVDNSLIGEYNLTYKVADAAGNLGSAKRKVVVSAGDAPGVVYLTFDDGPNEGTTDVILDILKEEGVQATFFVTNYGPDELIVREHNEGHTVALHTASHDYAKIYSSDEAYFNDLQAVSDRVERLTGVKTMYMRFPGGASNTVSRRYSNGIMSRLTQEVQNRGYKYFDWNVSSGDAGNTTDPKQVYANVTSSLRKDRANMVLMHDVKPYTRDALRDIIRFCKNNGYQIKKITNCTEMVTQRVNN